MSRAGLLGSAFGILIGCDAGGVAGELASPAAAGSGQPHLARTPAGDAVMSWLEQAQSGHRLRLATLRDGGWSAPVTVASGDNWFVNWADFPSVTAIDESHWLAHWLVRAGDSPYAYDVYLAQSRDAGGHWGAPFKLHHDGTLSEHGFVSIFPAPAPADGRSGGDATAAGLVWLDGRETVTGGSMTLRSATVGVAGLVADERVLDARVCDCCQTDAALTDAGPIVVYRDRSIDEIRDIAIVRWRDGGWTEPEIIAADGWRIEGCPVNGPAVAAHGSDVAVVWYTAADAVPRVRLSRSFDGGMTFTAPLDVSAGSPLGRVDVVLTQAGEALVGWLERDADGGAELRLRRYGANADDIGASQVVVRTALNRPAGFPQLLWMDDDLLISWTDVNEKPNRVRTLTIDLSAFD